MLLTRLRCQFRLIAMLALAGGMLLLDARGGDFVGPPAPDDRDKHDPFPIRRVLLANDRLPAELERSKEGAWQRMSRREFESLVRAAAKVVRRQVEAPRLVEAHYRAKLLRDSVDDNSLEGSGEWKVVNGNSGPSILALESVGVALKQARWQNNNNAVIGLIDPKSPPGFGLLVEGRGEKSLAIEWSARAIAAPGELRFDLVLPSSPIASLDIDLPTNIVPVLAQDEALLEGPIAIGNEPRRMIWRIVFGGLSHLELSLRLADDAQPRPPILISSASRFELSAGAVVGQFTFEFQAARGDVSTLIVEHDPDLSPTDVSVLNLESWSRVAGSASGRKRLEIRLREPARGGQLRIAARSSLPLNDAAFWTAPAMNVVGAVSRSQILRVQIPSDLKLIDWRPGTFRIARVEPGVNSSTLVCEPTLVPDGQNPLNRPAARFQWVGADYGVRQATVWTVEADRSTLASRVEVEVHQGSINQLQFRMPPGAEVAKVEFNAKDPEARWTIKSGPNPLLQIEWTRALGQGAAGRLAIELRLPGAGTSMSQKTLPFPDLIPPGARKRSGEYRVRVSPALAASAPPSNLDEQFVGPIKSEADDNWSEWIYGYYRQPPIGPLVILARLPRFSATADHIVEFETNRLATTTRLALQPESGAVSGIVLFASEPLPSAPSPRIVQGVNQVVSVEEVPVDSLAAAFNAVGSRQPIQAAAWLSSMPKGRWWLVHFARPLAGPVVLESHYDLTWPFGASDAARHFASAFVDLSRSPVVGCITAVANLNRVGGQPFAVPLLTPVHAIRQQGSVRVLRPSNRGAIIASAALILEAERRGRFASDTRFRIADGVVALTIDPGKRNREISPMRIDTARLVSAADLSGRHRCWFAFRIQGEISERLPITLPAHSEVEAVAIAGRILRQEQVQCDSRDDGTVCSFALPIGEGWQTVEVLYSIPVPKWRVSAHLSENVPRLPVKPNQLSIEWRLPPDVAPIDPSKLTRLSGRSNESWRSQANWLTFPFEYSPSVFRELSDGRPIAPNAKGTLPKTVQQALLNPGSATEKPLIDVVGLLEAGVYESTPAPVGGWDVLGLTLVGFPGGTVLTTPRQASIWRALGATGADSNSVQQALNDAIQNGRDASGRFRTVADWVETLPSNHALVLLPRLGGDGPGWSSWQVNEVETLNGTDVASRRNVTAIGWIFAALLAIIGILLVGRLGAMGAFLLASWLLITGAALQWLPVALRGLAVGPMLAGLLVAVISTMRRKSKRSESPTSVLAPSTRRRVPVALVAGSALITGWLAVAATAAAPESVTVYLLPGSAQDPEPKTVLVPIDLMKRLKALADPAPAVAEYVLLNATWAGRSNLNSVDFEARLVIHSFAKRGRIDLPLGEARLREALLDGAAAFPKPVGGGRYTLEFEGEGEHRVDLNFSVAVGGTGADREVRFNVPEAAIASLVFQTPPGGDRPQVMNWHGAQRLAVDGKEIRADLGRAKSIQVRWRQPGVNVEPVVRVQEAAVWDLSQSNATLYAAFDYRVAPGSLQSIKIALPPNVEISRLEIRPGSNSGVAAPSWIRDWSVSANRELHIELQAGLTGSFQLLMEAVANRSLSNRPSLQYPSALGISERETYVAYRLGGLDAAPELERRGVTDFSAASFVKDIWRPAAVEQAPAAVTRAFRRTKNDTIFLRPLVTIAPHASHASQELLWLLGPRTSELKATVRWQSAAEPLTFVEWEVAGGLLVHDVRGSNVHSWLRIGNRIQVWLREPAPEVALLWHGEVPRGGPPAETTVIDLPLVRLEGARMATTTIRASSPKGWALSVDNPAVLGAAIPKTTLREFSWSLSKPSATARFILRGPQNNASCKVLSVAEVVQRQFRLTAFVESNLNSDRPHSLVMALGDTAGWEVSIQVPSDCRALLQSRNADRQEWVLDIPARDDPRIPITVVLSRPAGVAQDIALPHIELSEGDRPLRMDNWILLLGPEMRISDAGNPRRSNDKVETVLANHQRELTLLREHGGSLWQADLAYSRTVVRAASEPLSASPVARLGLVDVEAAHSGGRWIYRVAVDLVHEAGAPLECRLPAGSTLVGLAIDGTEVPLPEAAERFAIPLPYESGPRLLQLVWIALEPSWEPPVFRNGFNGHVGVPAIWTAMAGPGERLGTSSTDSIAVHDLKRADALARLATERGSFTWSNDAQAQIASRILLRTGLAEASLSSPHAHSFVGERGPNGIALGDWAARLREQAQSMRGSRPPAASTSPPIREATFDKLPYAEAFRIGSPLRWSAGPHPQEVRVLPASAWSPLPALASVSLIAIVVAVLVLLMLFLSRTTRPEQLAVIGLLGAVAFGPPEGVFFFGLTAVALLIRTGWASRRVYRWLGG